MRVKVRDRGRYELLEAADGRRVLVLNGERRLAWTAAPEGDHLEQAVRGGERERMLQEGEFYLVDYREDPRFRDMPHLFLERAGGFDEYMLPDGLPGGRSARARLVTTGDELARDELEAFLGHQVTVAPDDTGTIHPGGGSTASLAHSLDGLPFPADREAMLRYARSRGAPEDVIGLLDGVGEGRFSGLADVMDAVFAAERRGRRAAERDLSISDYGELTEEEVKARLADLSREQLATVKALERAGRKRRAILEEIDRRLG